MKSAGEWVMGVARSSLLPLAGEGGLRVSGGRWFGIGAAPANAALKDALLRLAASVTPTVQSIAVPASAALPPSVVHLLPVRRAARDVLTGADDMLIVTEIGQQPAPDGAVLSSLFDLTPAEARIAASLATGATLAATAAALSISVSTTRSHLSAVFSKTGTARQAELVSLLSSMKIAGGRV